MESPDKQLHVVVHGRVQGVGFRWFVRVRARALGLRGWVRNRDDGSVEVLAEGAHDDVRSLEEALVRGPDGARVESVRRAPSVPTEPAQQPFAVLR